MKLFLIAPLNGEITKNSTVLWAQKLADIAAELKLDMVEPLIGSDVTRAKVEETLIPFQQQPGFICFLDHGTKDILKDSQGSALLEKKTFT